MCCLRLAGRLRNRFEFAHLLIDHGVVSLMNMPIFLPGEEPYGLPQVNSPDLRKSGDRDIPFLRTSSPYASQPPCDASIMPKT